MFQLRDWGSVETWSHTVEERIYVRACVKEVTEAKMRGTQGHEVAVMLSKTRETKCVTE